MRIKLYVARAFTGVLAISLLTMCTKQSNKIDAEVSATKAKHVVRDTAMAITAAYVPLTPPVASFTINPSSWFFDGTDVPPGSIIYIPAGVRGSLLIKNVIGTSANPIVIINQGGKVTITAAPTASYAFKTQNCRNIKVFGNGDGSVNYGIDINGGNIGMTFDDLTTAVEVYDVEVRNCSFAGIMAKTDPTCDVATQRGNFTMSNIKIHRNYVHKTGGEGLYIGNSFYADGVSLACGRVYPHDVTNVRIYNNLIDSTGCEGIQVGSAVANCEIYKNTVRNPGISPFASGQNNGIQIGEGTAGKCYGNLIKNAPGNGIIVLGFGGNSVYNNIIVNTGGHGIFADSRFTPGPFFQFINNTIINPGMDGIKMNSEIIPMNTVINNVIVIPGSGIGINRKNVLVKLTNLSNYVTRDINTCQFVNPAAGDFHLQPTSPLIDAGADVFLYGLLTDFYDEDRPAGAVDIGAVEY